MENRNRYFGYLQLKTVASENKPLLKNMTVCIVDNFLMETTRYWISDFVNKYTIPSQGMNRMKVDIKINRENTFVSPRAHLVDRFWRISTRTNKTLNNSERTSTKGDNRKKR